MIYSKPPQVKPKVTAISFYLWVVMGKPQGFHGHAGLCRGQQAVRYGKKSFCDEYSVA